MTFDEPETALALEICVWLATFIADDEILYVIFDALGYTWHWREAGEVFDAFADRAPPLEGKRFDTIPLLGTVIDGFSPKKWPRRAPRPTEVNP